MQRKRKMIFLLLLAGCMLFSGCGQKEEEQEKGELVMISSSFSAQIS